MPDWDDFYKATEDKPPHPLLVEAVDYCVNKSKALDLGAGGLRDTRFLLGQDFEVVAIDNSPLMIAVAEKIRDQRLCAIQTSFDQYAFPKEEFDLVNAQWALPFNPRATFDSMFEKLKLSLKKDGVFTGQFFGKHDEWNTPESKMTFHEKGEIGDLLKNFEILKLQEEEKDGPTAVGTIKHWHVFHVIAKRIKSVRNPFAERIPDAVFSR
jgi:tellurite methyltransferase